MGRSGCGKFCINGLLIVSDEKDESMDLFILDHIEDAEREAHESRDATQAQTEGIAEESGRSHPKRHLGDPFLEEIEKA